jgi:hypothetical protein
MQISHAFNNVVMGHHPRMLAVFVRSGTFLAMPDIGFAASLWHTCMLALVSLGGSSTVAVAWLSMAAVCIVSVACVNCR